MKMKSRIAIVLLCGVMLFFAGCAKEEPCDYSECSLVAPAAEIQQVQNYLSANNIQATRHCSGLSYRIEQQGTGKSPNACSSVTVTYEGKLTNGNKFDGTTSPVTFSLWQLIPAWRNGLPQLKAGGKIYLYVPPSLGYGSQQVGTIPPNSVLIFEVSLLSVN